jgi:hypothetical protein
LTIATELPRARMVARGRIFDNLIAALVFTGIFSLIGIPSAIAAADAGEVVIFKGDCFKETGGQRSVLKLGDDVKVGDVVEVPAGAKLRLRMSDGSVLSLGSGSQMTIETYDVSGDGAKRDAKLALATGLMRAMVSKVSEPSTFEVETAVGVGAARSTDWFVEADAQSTRVSVLDGSVSLAPNAPPSKTNTGIVIIPPRSASELAARGTPTPPQPATQADFDRLIDLTNIVLGWCQCTDDTADVHAVCQATPDGCKAYCRSISSFIPNARLSCGALEAIPKRAGSVQGQ